MIVVADTSPINYLVLISKVDLLRELFGTLVIPNAVREELSAGGSPQEVRTWLASNPDWLIVESPRTTDSTINLGAGECETISLAKEKAADLTLIDDRKACRCAKERGLNVAGTINLLEVGSRKGLVDLAASFVKLRQTNFSHLCRFAG